MGWGQLLPCYLSLADQSNNRVGSSHECRVPQGKDGAASPHLPSRPGQATSLLDLTTWLLQVATLKPQHQQRGVEASHECGPPFATDQTQMRVIRVFGRGRGYCGSRAGTAYQRRAATIGKVQVAIFRGLLRAFWVLVALRSSSVAQSERSEATGKS